MRGKQIEVISFVGGLVFFSVVVGIVLVKNERIRTEVEEQAMSLLKTTKNALNQAQFLISKVGMVTGERKASFAGSHKTDVEAAMQGDAYEALWG